jgi:Mg-chelatase subunit ChlD
MRHSWKVVTFLVVVSLALLSSCSMAPIWVPAVSSVQSLSVVPDKDFAKNGVTVASIIPLDSSGAPIIDSAIGIKGTFTSTKNKSVDLTVGDITEKKPTSTTLPWAYVIDIDSSGSMSSSDPNDLRIDASKNFVDLILGYNAKNQLNISTFGYSSVTKNFTATYILQDFSSDSALLKKAIDKVQAENGTPLWDSAVEMLGYLDTQKASNSYNRGMVILSDGDDNESSSTAKAAIAAAQAKHIPVSTVALKYDSDNLKQMASSTSGIYIMANTASDLTSAFQNISIGTTKGYLTLKLTFPSSSIPTSNQKVDITLSVQGGTGSASTCTLSFTTP